MESQPCYMKHIVVVWPLILGGKFLDYGQVFLTVQLLTSRWQNKIVKIAVFLRNCVFYQHKSI